MKPPHTRLSFILPPLPHPLLRRRRISFPHYQSISITALRHASSMKQPPGPRPPKNPTRVSPAHTNKAAGVISGGKFEMPEITFYEQDEDQRSPPRRVGSVSTREELRAHEREFERVRRIEEEEDEEGEGGFLEMGLGGAKRKRGAMEDVEGNIGVLEELMRDPEMRGAGLQGELGELMGVLSGRNGVGGGQGEREERMVEKKSMTEEQRMMDLGMKRDVIEALLQDPEMRDVRDELRELRGELQNLEVGEEELAYEDLVEGIEDLEERDFLEGKKQVLLGKDGAAVEDQEREIEDEEEREEDERGLERRIDNVDLKKEMVDLAKMLKEPEMRELLKEMKKHSPDEPTAQSAAVVNDFANKTLKEEIAFNEDGDEGLEIKDLDDELADMESDLHNPAFAEKLDILKQILASQNSKHSTPRLTAASPPSKFSSKTPGAKIDPSTLPPTALLPLKSRIALASTLPEHQTALSRLTISLPHPHSRNPRVAHLNAVLRTAYMGANEDIRKALWRAYVRAKTVPGFLEAVTGDAWEMLWASQGVRWRGNEKREEHLEVLRGDMRQVGRGVPGEE
ncbi:hypothetical protein K432DRAFT_386118 [Lepidopterella palustris CBS 459.81]|uniref:Uncharacterized protein n=1 Tax=Lepidopterella palustris CBS 459.81 TaxID=1314670 RepID=A0A8E2E1M0_9PEZI|nr:hypothetical protein K432DRAFT_386118 [Lepidopterella palustris CBS 459.81]